MFLLIYDYKARIAAYQASRQSEPAPEIEPAVAAKGFPSFRGVDIAKEVTGYMALVTAVTSLTQGRLLFSFLFLGLSGFNPAGGEDKAEAYGTIERMGLTTEVVSASTLDSFSEYLDQKSLLLPDAFETVLADYLGKNYSFVVSWISDLERFTREQGNVLEDGGNTMSVFISFPTGKIFYPLKATSVYGETVIPLAVYVLDFVDPRL